MQVNCYPSTLRSEAFEQWTHFLKFNNCNLRVQLSNQSSCPFKRNHFLLQILLSSIFRSLLSLGSLTTASRRNKSINSILTTSSWEQAALYVSILLFQSSLLSINVKLGSGFVVFIFSCVIHFVFLRRWHPNVFFAQIQTRDKLP